MAKIAVAHFLTGERDGVSLVIDERRKALQRAGHNVHLITGSDPKANLDPTIHLISGMDLKSPGTRKLRSMLFDSSSTPADIAESNFKTRTETFFDQLGETFTQEDFDLIFVHNMFSLGYNLPASIALLSVLDRIKKPVVAVNHDFHWDRPAFSNPQYEFVLNHLNSLPPKRPYMSHLVINSQAQTDLEVRTGMKSDLAIDHFNFNQKLPEIDDFNSDFLDRFGIGKNDVIVLHATRIVERKAIENSIKFVAELEKTIHEGPNFTFGNREISKSSKVHLLLPNFVESGSELYKQKLVELGLSEGVNIIFAEDDFALERGTVNGRKKYSFWEAYLFADLITYTSIAEGYGNQLLEAFWSRKPVVLFEYPVYKTDIKVEGYDVISLGDEVERFAGLNYVAPAKVVNAAQQAKALLENSGQYSAVVNRNYSLAKSRNDLTHLESELTNLVRRNLSTFTPS